MLNMINWTTWTRTPLITIGLSPIITGGQILFQKRFSFILFRFIVVKLIIVLHTYITPQQDNALTQVKKKPAEAGLVVSFIQ